MQAAATASQSLGQAGINRTPRVRRRRRASAPARPGGDRPRTAASGCCGRLSGQYGESPAGQGPGSRLPHCGSPKTRAMRQWARYGETGRSSERRPQSVSPSASAGQNLGKSEVNPGARIRKCQSALASACAEHAQGAPREGLPALLSGRRSWFCLAVSGCVRCSVISWVQRAWWSCPAGQESVRCCPLVLLVAQGVSWRWPGSPAA